MLLARQQEKKGGGKYVHVQHNNVAVLCTYSFTVVVGLPSWESGHLSRKIP